MRARVIGVAFLPHFQLPNFDTTPLGSASSAQLWTLILIPLALASLNETVRCSSERRAAPTGNDCSSPDLYALNQFIRSSASQDSTDRVC